MKRLQTRVSDVLYQRVRREAYKSGKSVDALVRDALTAYLHMDPIFRAFPLVKGKGPASDNVSERHDEILYGNPHETPR